ncbi:MAG: hypothetical protein R3F07_09670 [Opitutaceae bacterium]
MRKHLPFASFLFVLIALSITFIEFIYLPHARHLPREFYLMGWVGYPDTQIDDTTLNSIGLTGDVPEPVRPVGTIRVLTLGGSAIFNRRFTERLKTSLQEQSTRTFEVVGAAYRGHTTRSSVIKAAFLTKRYPFDFILIYHAINDTWANNVAPDDFRSDYSHLDAWYRRNWILENSILARDLYNSRLYRKPARREGESAFRSAETFRANLEILVRTAIEHGSIPLLVTFATCVPTDYTLDRFLAGEVSYNNPERHDPRAIEEWGPKDTVLEGVRRHNAITREVAADLDVPLLDASAIFGSNPLDFGDVCHFSEPGTDRFAGLLAGFLIEQTD